MFTVEYYTIILPLCLEGKVSNSGRSVPLGCVAIMRPTLYTWGYSSEWRPFQNGGKQPAWQIGDHCGETTGNGHSSQQAFGLPPFWNGLHSPMSAVARRLRYDHSYLRRHFPDLCRAISDRYRAYRKKKREERRQRILDEVRRTTYRVYKQGSYPSQERIRLLLAKPGSIKEPGALAVWHEALAELGLESKEP